MPTRPKSTGKGRQKKDEEMSWMVSFEYTELQSMREWGLNPKSWRDCSKKDRVKMLAYSRVKAKMEAADNQIMSDKMDKASGEAKRSQGKQKGRR